MFFSEVPSASAFDSNGLLDEEPIQTSVFKQEREEPEKIRAWREEQKKRLEEKGMIKVLILCTYQASSFHIGLKFVSLYITYLAQYLKEVRPPFLLFF